MSMSVEMAEKYKKEPAVLCCRKEAGNVISADDLEDPVIFPDLEESGLLNLDDSVLTVEQVIGATMVNTLDSLTAVTADDVDKVQVESVEEKVEEVEETKAAVQAQTETSSFEGGSTGGGVIKIHIGEGKDINLEIPMVTYGSNAGSGAVQGSNAALAQGQEAVKEEEAKSEEKTIRSLVKKHFQIDKVEFGPETKIDGTTLYIRENIIEDAVNVSDLVKKVKVDIITPEKYNTYSETIMDVQPIATKEEGSTLGTGVTRVIDGVVMVVTGTDEAGVQIGEFGSSEGIIEENIMWGRPGAPDKGEILIKTEIVIKEHTGMERPGPLAAHKATDFITQEIREALKGLDESLIVNEEEFNQVRRPGKKKVVIVKEIMGQGAMHDNLILPMEPVGVLGAKPNVDLGNVPVVCSPLEILDGALHALTCIGPASKENSRHYWREPLVIEALRDEEIDLCGVVIVGSPQINSEKFYVSERVGMTVEAMDVDGAFVTTEGFGNNHIDFASHIDQIGKRGIPVVGSSFCAVQGELVVGNEHMKYMIDHNKSEEGIENEILSCNTLTQEDALRAIAMLKAAIAGEDIEAPERKWNPNVKENNLELLEEATGNKIERPDNETSLPENAKKKAKEEADAK